jgi:2-isopropylmalate synthase
MLEIYDCTLREGEQAEGASFSSEGRIELCKMLDEFGVEYVELGWPLASQEIFNSFKQCMQVIKKAKIVAFGSTSIKDNPEEDENLNSIVLCGAKHACIFGKANPEHVEKQLKISKEENLKKIQESIGYLKSKDIEAFYDAEHYFDGYKKDKEYAIQTLVAALKGGAKRLILCDTNGGILPEEALEIVKNTHEELVKKGFQPELGVHFHDDGGLALANTLNCIPYIKQVQGTINGIGERLGNLNFSEFLPIYMKKMNNELGIELKQLKKINEQGFKIAGIKIPEKRAFVGDTAFAHKGGVHIDAVSKGAGYEHENPEEFGNKTTIILNSLGGRSSVVRLAEQFGYSLDKKDLLVREKIQELFEELKNLEKQGYRLGMLKAEQYLLINKYFGNKEKILEVLEWNVNSELRLGKERSYFKITCRLDKELFEDSLTVEGGPVDAAFKTLKKIIRKKYPEIENLKLVDFHVSIAIRHGEESAVRTEIFFSDGEEFSTVGVDKNILGSAIEALEKGFRYEIKQTFSKKV